MAFEWRGLTIVFFNSGMAPKKSNMSLLLCWVERFWGGVPVRTRVNNKRTVNVYAFNLQSYKYFGFLQLGHVNNQAEYIVFILYQWLCM